MISQATAVMRRQTKLIEQKEEEEEEETINRSDQTVQPDILKDCSERLSVFRNQVEDISSTIVKEKQS